MVTSNDATAQARLWLTCFEPNPQSSLRLFCFPYAGGSATVFRTWSKSLPAAVEVWAMQPPGRGSRLKEPPIASLPSLVDSLAAAIRILQDKPFAFFGHSLGALVSFELAHRLRDENRAGPVHLFASGHRAPGIPETEPILHNLPEPEFIDQLRKLNGTPHEVLEHPELMELLTPALRADFEMNETYAFSTRPPLACPITALGGLQDREVAREHLEPWRDYTTGRFSLRMLPGDHFFLHSSEAVLLQVLSRELMSVPVEVSSQSYS